MAVSSFECYWESLNALDSFGADADHKWAKQQWTEWYDAYEITVTEVIETYGSGFGDDADPPGSTPRRTQQPIWLLVRDRFCWQARRLAHRYL